MYVTLSETQSELRDVAGSHGWTLENIEVFELANQEEASASEGYTISGTSGGDIE